MKLPIADGRLPIRGSFSRRSLARGRHDGGEFIRFSQKSRQFALRHDAGLDQQFQPERGFVSLFLNRADLGNELRLASGPATGAVVCGHGSSAAQNLPCDDAPSVFSFGNLPTHCDDAQGKSLGAGFQFSRSHDVKLQIQSAIGNWQSSMFL